VEHWLPAHHEITPVLAKHLFQRGPRTGVDEEIYFERSQGEPALAGRFSSAGWKTSVGSTDAGRSAAPQMRVFGPDGVLAWSGEYRLAELRGTGATVLDDVVLLRLARGESGPDHVPVGCSIPLRSREGISR
jgi:hypothetical protein